MELTFGDNTLGNVTNQINWTLPYYQKKDEIEEMTEGVDFPELYPENLVTISRIIEDLDNMSLEGLFEIEIRIRIDDSSVWVVIGHGESSDPCVVRFEYD
jgi:hypothetical protein